MILINDPFLKSGQHFYLLDSKNSTIIHAHHKLVPINIRHKLARTIKHLVGFCKGIMNIV